MSPAPPTLRDWLSLSVALLAVLALLHGGLVWGVQVLCGGDIVNQAHPLTVFWISSTWLQGWIPHSFSGRPFFADIQSATLYPPRWLFWAGFPVEHVTTFLCLAHSLFGAVGMYLLSRIRFHHLPAMLAAIVWIGGGYTLLRYTNGVVTLIYALAWVPWTWWAVELCHHRRPVMTGVLALCAAMLFLAGSPQVVFITAIGMAIWAIGRLSVEESTTAGRLRLLSHYFMAGLTAFVVVLPQFIASAEYTAAAVGRGGSAQWEHLVGDSLGPWLLLTNLAPGFFAAGNAEGMYWGSQSGFMETNAYIGIAPLMLALFGSVVVVGDWNRLDRTGKRWFVCLLVLFMVGLLVAFGRFTPIYRLLYDFIPGFNLFRVPARWLLWPFAVGILLAAWGADILLQRGGDRDDKRPLLAWAIISASMMVGVLLLLVFVEPVMKLFGFNPAATSLEMVQHLQALSRSALTWAFSSAFAAAAVGLACLWTRKLPPQAAVVLLIIWTVFDLNRFWTPYKEPLPHEFFTRQELPSETIYHKIDASAFQEWFYPRTPLIELLDSPPDGRYFYTDWLYSYMVDEHTREIYTERGIVHGLESMRGYQPLQLESYATDFARISDVTLDTPSAVGSFLFAPETRQRGMLDAYNATRVLTYETSRGEPEARTRFEAMGLVRETAFPFGLEVWRNPHAPGWAWLSRDGQWPALDSRITEAPVTVEERTPGQTIARVRVPEGGAWLHFSEVDYPGWEMYVDYEGDWSSTLTVEGRSVHLPHKGSYDYKVRHVFRLPAATRLTLPLSGVAMILLLAFIGWQGMRAMQEPAPREDSNQDSPLQNHGS